MYRTRASKSALQGVLSGPYAGGSRTLDAGKLPRHVRQRLADVLAYRAEPSPLLHDRPSRTVRFRASWVLVAALFAFLVLTAYRLGDPESALAILPPVFLLAYALPSAGIVFSLLALIRRRARVGGDSLSPGRWLLPLDIVEVEAPDADGKQRIVVTPLGDARDAEVLIDGRRRELVISFTEKAPIAFPLRADVDGEVTLKRLEHAQHLLEDLTYGRNLEKALAQDPFFDVRVDGSWSELADAGSAVPRREQILHGRAGTLGAAALAALVAVSGWAGRNRASDRTIFLQAARAHTPEAYDAYLARGTAYRQLAIGLREQAVQQRRYAEAERKRQEAEDARNAVDARSPHERCLDNLREHGAPSHPRVTRALEDIVATARERNTSERVPVAFLDETREPFEQADALNLTQRENEIVRSFERVFSEVCPATALYFVRAAVNDKAFLEIRYRVTKGGAPWKVTPNPHVFQCGDNPAALATQPCPEGGKLVVQPLAIDFDVRVPSAQGGDAASFHLAMPPPATPGMVVRERSLFSLRGPPVAPDTFDLRVYESMSARAFDRLYDEIHGLFLEGDPVVPLREDWIVAPPGAGHEPSRGTP